MYHLSFANALKSGVICMIVLLWVLFSVYCFSIAVRSPYLSGASSSYAELNNTFTFMCTVSDSSRNTDEVRFQRETHEIALLKQMTSRCVVVNITQPEHYSASCGPGTSSVLSRSKTYTLTIKKVSLEDNTKWFCETNNPHRRSQSFKFRFKGK